MAEWLFGAGEMAGRIRAHDWAATSLGPVEGWPASLRTAVELMLAAPQIASLVVGSERVFLYNNEAAKHYGARHPRALGLSIATAFPGSYAEVARFYDRVFAGESVHVPAQPLDTAGTGEREVFDAYLTPVRDAEERVIAALMTGVAASERVRTEAALRDSEGRFRALVGAGAVTIYRMSPHWQVMYELDSKGFLAPTPEPIAHWADNYILPEDQPMVMAAISEAIRTRSNFELEHRVALADGSVGWVSSRAVPMLGPGGEIVEWFGAASDITARKRAEQALRESEELRRVAVEGARMGTWRWNVREELIWGDVAFLSLWGFAPSDEPRHLSDFTERMSPQGQAEMGEMVTRALQAGEVFDGQLAVVSGVTSGHWVRWRGRAERERPWIVNGISFDVTDQRTLDERLRESEERQTFLLKLGDALRTEEGVEAVGGLAARMIADELALDRIYFVTASSENDEVSVTHDVRRADMPPMLGLYHSSDFPSAIKEFLERPIIYTDVRTDPRLTELDRRSFAGFGAVGFAAVPIRRGTGTLIWAIGAVSTKPRDWTAGDISLLEEAAERTWAAIERVRADASLRASEQALAADLAGASLLRDLAERLVTEENLTTIHDEILSAAMTITRSDAGTVQLYEPETKSLVLLATSGLEPEMTDHFHRIDATNTTGCGIALREGRRTFVDFDQDETDDESRRHVAAGLRSAQATPLISRTGAPLGMLNTHWRASGHRPNERELRFLDLLARQAADLIERAQSQQRLRESEERLRQFGEASKDVIWIRDAQTLQWTYLTPAFETIYGLSRDEALTDDNYRSWLDLIVPEDRARASEMIARAAAGEQVTFEYRVRRPRDGAIRWLRNTDFPIFNDAGKVELIGGIGHDATDLRESELRLRALVEGMPQLVWRAVDGGEWTWASPQWTAYTGQSNPDSHRCGWLEPVHPDDRDTARAAWLHAVETGGFEVEYRIRNAGAGDYRWFQTRATPVRDKASTITEWLGTSTDIHDLRTLQEQQHILVAELQHRTRNLMGVVGATFETTLRSSGGLEDFAASYRDRIRALARVQSLLSRLNNHDRITFDELIQDEFRAVGALDRVVLAGPSGVALRSSTVQTFAMALHELTTNAVKYGALSQAYGRIEVTWRLDSKGSAGQPWLYVDWQESGVTMPPAGASPQGTGQGRQLIEKALPYQLGARTTYLLGPDGVRCSIAVPVSARAAAEDTANGDTSAS